jgi:four helix bundle protein
MDNTEWQPSKPYNLRERLLDFAGLIVRLVQYLHTQGRVPARLSDQLLDSATSAAANFEEADDGSSPRDTQAKQKIALREMKETRFWLRLLRRSGFTDVTHDPLLQESDELVRILATIIRKGKKE